MAAARIWGRGQLTIPSGLRKALGIENDCVVDLVKAGESILLTPRPLQGDRLAARMERDMKKRDITLDDLLKDLKKTRKQMARSYYGR
jgi:bifunctional DNA-binding transcriptional regulator/antitoxin component of YhaV-PrlF toxin-antitoxin module